MMITANKWDIWYLDLGASAHMTCRWEWLHHFTLHCPTMSVILGNNATLDVQGSGTVRTTITSSGQTTSMVLWDVLFIPGLTKNLVSMSCLVDLGCTIQLDCAGTTVQHPQQSFPPLVARLVCNMLVVELSPTTITLVAQALLTRTRPTITLDHLHLCLGHIGVDQLKTAALTASNIAVNMESELLSCTACIQAKQHKKKIGHGPAPWSDTPMALIHSNICGPFPMCLFMGKIYFISMINDHSQHTTVYFLREKSKVPAHL